MSINDASTIAELAKASVALPSIVGEQDGGRKFLVVPQGFRAEEITDPYGLVKEPPAYPIASVLLDSAESFCKFSGDYAGSSSAVFGSFRETSFTFVGDYHGALDEPGRCEFWASYTLQTSTQWDTWIEAGRGALHGQLDFLRFIEENQDDVVAPSRAELLEMLKDFHAVRTMSVKKTLRAQFGVERFEFCDETRTGAVELPTKISILVPVYEYTEPVLVDLFLRWKIADNEKLMLGLKIKNPKLIERNAFDAVAAKISSGIPSVVPYYSGSPGDEFVKRPTSNIVGR